MLVHLVALCCIALAWLDTLAQNLTEEQIRNVEAQLATGVQAWETGIRSQALLELNVPAFSVLTKNPLPPPTTIPSNISPAMSTILSIAHTIVSNRSTSNGAISGPQPLVANPSAADPASNGMVVLLANWTGQGNNDGLDYAGAAQDQLNFLYVNVSKTPDGAISHRMDQLQLWSDFIYMVPPFLAYYGVTTANQTLLEDAYTQISLYRSYQRDTNNLWKHVTLGTNEDLGHWSTGNGWAAAGMLRVLGTIAHSQFAGKMKQEQIDLANWVQEIHDGMYANLDTNWLFRNYADQDLSSTNFYDASSTALMASTVYRLAIMWGVDKYIPLAEKSRTALLTPGTAPLITVANNSTVSPSSSTTVLGSTTVDPSSSRSSTALDLGTATSTTESHSSTSTTITLQPTSTTPSGLQHFTNDWWLTPVVNPYDFSVQGTESPEGQAFVLEMISAWRDWESRSANAATQNVGVGWIGLLILAAGLQLAWQ